ncbi:SRPBCC family protein [Nocardioides insulae]|uniref:SRPBCC family protein n=1 Tax=Nocardioides insulae TaxID=394734 RepID=UPI0003F88B0C|nr:SRPBCC family protein [Nocardioides insulae]
MDIRRTLVLTRPPEEVFAYLRDFTTTEEWDSGTIRTTLLEGDGGVGTRYHNVSRFLGRQTELTYVVEEDRPPRRLRLRGENPTVRTQDTMTLSPTASGGTQLSYHAEFTFIGLARWVAPLLGPAFRRLGEESEKGLREALR